MNIAWFNIKDQSYLKVKSDYLPEYIRYINGNKIRNVVLNKSWGYHLDNVDFLKDCPAVEGISIVPLNINVDGLRNCSNLVHLHCKSLPKNPVSLAAFPKLERISFNDIATWTDLESAKSLQEIEIWKYRGKNLAPLRNLKGLSAISIYQSKIETLAGGEDLPHLTRVHIAHSSSFSAIECVGNRSLEKIHLETTKKFTGYNNLISFPNLREIILMKSGAIQDIHFLKALTKLEMFTAKGTLIENGDIEYLKQIPVLYIDYEKHYSFNYGEFMLAKLKR